MIARIDSIDGELIGIHRTYLRSDGSGKADVKPVKAMLGHTAGGAVRLTPAAEALLVGEGVESVLAAMILTHQPGWAALSTSGLVGLILPPVVRHVIICADNDAPRGNRKIGAGQKAARDGALRWAREGRRVQIITPDCANSDMNDLLREARRGPA